MTIHQNGNTNNNLYNLMQQLVEENKSLWHIRKYYLDDADDCKDCQKLWHDMIEAKSEWVARLEPLVQHYINQ